MTDPDATLLSLDTLVVAVPRVVARPTDDGLVLVNLDTGYLFELNQIGARVWRQIAEHGSVRRTLESLVDQYRVERSILEKDVILLIRDLRLHRLIDVVEPAKTI